MKLTDETLKNLILEVLTERRNAEKDRLDALMRGYMDDLSDAENADIRAKIKPAPNSSVPLDYVICEWAKKAKADFFKDRDRAARAKTTKGYRNRGVRMGQDDPGDVTDIYGVQNYEEGLMYEGDASILEMFEGATLEEGDLVCEGCLFEMLQEASCGCPDLMGEAEYQGRKVSLNKPTRGDVKKFKVYVKDPTTGNVKKVNFGHGGTSAKAKGEKTMKIRKNNPKARKSFRARHNCSSPGPKTKARYWSCKKW